MSLKALLLHTVAVLVGGVAAEGLLRSLIESDAMFSIAFSPGAKAPNDKFGFLYQPHFRGHMRHPDRVWSVPLELDEYGFRPAARSPGADPTRVAIVAGRSMTMCYGLPWKDTIQARMVARSDEPLEVCNTGWAGFDPYRSWHYFLDTLDAKEEPFDVALFCYNVGTLEPFVAIPEGFEVVPEHPAAGDFFYMLPSNIRMPKDELERWMGPRYFDSYVVYGLLRYREFIPKAASLLGVRTPQAMRGLFRLERTDSPADEPEPDPARSLAEGRARFAGFAAHMGAHFARRGTRFAVVFLPSQNEPVDRYDAFREALPDDVQHLDLHARLHPRLDDETWIALGHYGDGHTEMIAEELVRFVGELLEGRE